MDIYGYKRIQKGYPKRAKRADIYTIVNIATIHLSDNPIIFVIYPLQNIKITQKDTKRIPKTSKTSRKQIWC